LLEAVVIVICLVSSYIIWVDLHGLSLPRRRIEWMCLRGRWITSDRVVVSRGNLHFNEWI